MNTGTRQQHRAPRTAGNPASADKSSTVGRPIAVIDHAEIELADSYELPGGELPPDELALEIIAEQVDEFTCSSCFLVRHRSQLARENQGMKYCKDCEG
ncbi:hypothetical protein AS189_13865 [Arthrobacter alpinus]|uniref:dUTPase n=1 Tax=Arthrobacter alpinus TaxID=656366 RepID=A0A0S2M0T9_9MICC|nr:DUF4193 family protein [Arthrobacter alpinus]ALO67379.1 hypothetical protein AS189_13865 [Arthrobacter alpinus]